MNIKYLSLIFLLACQKSEPAKAPMEVIVRPVGLELIEPAVPVKVRWHIMPSPIHDITWEPTFVKIDIVSPTETIYKYEGTTVAGYIVEPKLLAMYCSTGISSVFQCLKDGGVAHFECEKINLKISCDMK